MQKYPFFNFNPDKITEYCHNKIKPDNEKLIYLEFVIKEYKNNQGLLGPVSILEITSPFIQKIRNEIEFINRIIEIKNSTANGKIKTETLNRKIEKIHWQGKEVELIYLFKELIDRGLLKEEKKYKMIADHFKQRNGKNFKPEILANSFQNMKKTYKNIDEITEAVNTFKKNTKD